MFPYKQQLIRFQIHLLCITNELLKINVKFGSKLLNCVKQIYYITNLENFPPPPFSLFFVGVGGEGWGLLCPMIIVQVIV